jgi:hypothetical protein
MVRHPVAAIVSQIAGLSSTTPRYAFLPQGDIANSNHLTKLNPVVTIDSNYAQADSNNLNITIDKASNQCYHTL